VTAEKIMRFFAKEAIAIQLPLPTEWLCSYFRAKDNNCFN